MQYTSHLSGVYSLFLKGFTTDALCDWIFGCRTVEKLFYNTKATAHRHAKPRLQKKARETLVEREVNDHQAYRTPMPGYTGNRPLVRSLYENCHKNGICKGQAAELYTVTKRDFNGFDVPGLNKLEHKRHRDGHVDYRMMCVQAV